MKKKWIYLPAVATGLLIVGAITQTLEPPVFAAQPIANEYPQYACAAGPVKWRPASQNVGPTRNSCTLPNSGAKWNSYIYGARGWNDLAPVIEAYYYQPDPNDCSAVLGDGISEIVLDEPEVLAEVCDAPEGYECAGYAPLVRTCSPSPTIVEADLHIDATMDFSDPSATTPETGMGRQTFLHEFGHWFGFAHDETGYFTVINPIGGSPTVAGTPSSVLWPNDTNGLNQLYGLASSLPNLIPSAHTVASGKVELIDDDTKDVCPGDTVYPKIYIGNTGKSNSGVFAVRVFLKSIYDPVGPTGGTTVATHFGYLNAFSEIQASIPFTIPESALEPDSIRGYDVNVYVDHTGSIAEVSNQDNWTISGMYIVVDARTGVSGTCATE